MADNHGSGPFDDDHEATKDVKMARNKLMRSLLDTTGFRGALGEFPQGQLTKSDEGSIQFAVGEKDGKVVIDFGTPVHWLGMSPQQAAEFASFILRRAREVARKNGETVSFVIGG